MLFFTKDIWRSMKARKRRQAFQTDSKDTQNNAFHTCTDCGVTEKINSNAEFRYYKDKEFCMDCLEKTKKDSA